MCTVNQDRGRQTPPGLLLPLNYTSLKFTILAKFGFSLETVYSDPKCHKEYRNPVRIYISSLVEVLLLRTRYSSVLKLYAIVLCRTRWRGLLSFSRLKRCRKLCLFVFNFVFTDQFNNQNVYK